MKIKKSGKSGLYIVKNFYKERVLAYFDINRLAIIVLHVEGEGWLEYPSISLLNIADIKAIKMKKIKSLKTKFLYGSAKIRK